MARCHRNKLSWIWHEVLSAAQTSGSTAGLTCWPAWDERTIQVCHGSATIIYSRTADVQDLNHFLKYDQLQETVRKSWTVSPLQPQSQSFQLENGFNGELSLTTSKVKNTLFLKENSICIKPIIWIGPTLAVKQFTDEQSVVYEYNHVLCAQISSRS